MTVATEPLRAATTSGSVLLRRLAPVRWEAVLVCGIAVAAAAVHAWNMFGYPYWENDEATYVSRGWAFITTGELDVYTYRYDHAPVGWMQIGVWLGLTGGTALFPSLLVSGRVLMLVLQVASTLLVYVAAKRLSGGRIAVATIASLVFALSPLGVYFHRRILLDNLLVFWLLVALVLAAHVRPTLWRTIGSGVAFGIAVLTKLYAAPFALLFLAVLWQRGAGAQRKHLLAQWLAFAGGTVLLYPIYAGLKSELMPARVGPDGQPATVSLLDTLALQGGRGTGSNLPPWDPGSDFFINVSNWLPVDPFLVIGGGIATVVLVVVGSVRARRDLPVLGLALSILAYLVFLARGGIVINLYITPLVPFLALAVGIVGGWALRALPRRSVRRTGALAGALSLVIVYGSVIPARALSQDETTNQQRALEWIRTNVPENAFIAADNYVYPQLAQTDGFDHVSYFFVTEYDPELQRQYADDWRNIDYLVVTHEVLRQIREGTVPKMRELLDHAERRVLYREGTSSYLDFGTYLSTNGDWAAVYQVKSRGDIVLQDTWERMRDEFVHDYGQVVDDSGPRPVTTSTAQATALRMALDQGDEATFTGLWQWTGDHLQHRATDRLISWRWDATRERLVSSDTVCSADIDIAQALLEAGERFENPSFTRDGERIVDDWWRQCTEERGGLRFVVSSADGSIDALLVNPGYFDPATYRAVSAFDPDHDWNALVEDGYEILWRAESRFGAVPQWMQVGRDGSLRSARPIMGASADRFGADAVSMVPSLVEESLVHDDARAVAALDRMLPALERFSADADRSVQAAFAALMVPLIEGDTSLEAARYRELLAADYAEGRWASGTDYAGHTWRWSWHDLQSRLPRELQTELE